MLVEQISGAHDICRHFNFNYKRKGILHLRTHISALHDGLDQVYPESANEALNPKVFR